MLTPYQTQQIITSLINGKSTGVVFAHYGAMREGMFSDDKSLLITIRSHGLYCTMQDLSALDAVSCNQIHDTVSVGSGIAFGLAADSLDRARGLEFDEVILVDSESFVRKVSVEDFGDKMRVVPAPLRVPAPAAAPSPTLALPDRFCATAYGSGPFVYELCDDGQTFESGQVVNLADIDSRFSAFRKLRLSLDGKPLPLSMSYASNAARKVMTSSLS